MLNSNATEAGGFMRSRTEVDRPDLQLHFCIVMGDDHNRHLHLATSMALHVCVLRPASRGRVLRAAVDAAVSPLNDLNFLSAPQDMELLVQGALIVRPILAASALAAYGGRPLYGTGEEDDD